MRSFIIKTAFALIAGLAGCSPDGKPCGSTNGCDDDPEPDAGNGGGEVCQAGEVGCADFATRPDDGECRDPDHPQACGDWCWSAETDCELPKHLCDGAMFRCFTADEKANCCEDMVVLCPSELPYWCPSNGACADEPCAITPGQCDYRGGSCGSF